MTIIKLIILLLLLVSSSYIGILISNKYRNRVSELKEMKAFLSIFSTKIKLTYEPIPQIFQELAEKSDSNIANLFQKASQNMQETAAGEAWLKALEEEHTNLKKEDIDTLKGLSSLLGKVDLEGQVSEIEVVDHFLNTQLEKAEQERKKNEKMYKVLGITVGLAMVIVLI